MALCVWRQLGSILGVWLVWAGLPLRANAQFEEVAPSIAVEASEPAKTGNDPMGANDLSSERRWFNFSTLTATGDGPSGGLLGEAVPPAVLLLDMSLPPGIDGSAPFGESLLLAPKSRVNNSFNYLSEFRQDSSLGAPLYSSKQDTLIGYLDSRTTVFDTSAYLIDSKRPFPNQLWNVDLGLSFSHRSDGWTTGGGFSISSPSDQPFHSLREIAPTANAFTRMPALNEPDAWLLSVTWMPVSVIRFPLPGVAYEWNPSKQLQVVAGVPFSISWKPNDRFRFDVGYMPLYQSRAQASFKLIDSVYLYAGFESLTEAYLLEDRTNSRDFFYNYENRLPVGVRIRLGEHSLLDIGGGYIFNRQFFSSTNFYDQNRDQTRVAPGEFGMLRFAVIF
jgi:hypothetical protein